MDHLPTTLDYSLQELVNLPLQPTAQRAGKLAVSPHHVRRRLLHSEVADAYILNIGVSS